MEEKNIGPAPVNGEQKAEETPQAQPQKQEPVNVPYTRFQEVVEQRKGLESTLTAIIDGMVSELPEDMRDLVPNLPAAEKAAWIKSAKERGLFTPIAPTSSPDAKRPVGKQPQDFTGFSPLQKMQAGYGQQ